LQAIQSIVAWFKSLSIGIKVILILGGLLVAILASRAVSIIAGLVVVVGVVALIVQVIRRRPLRQWGILTLSALAVAVVFGGVANALYGPTQPRQESVVSEQQEEEPAFIEEAEQDANTEEIASSEEETSAGKAEEASLEVQQETPAEEVKEAQVEEIVQVEYDETVRVTRVVDGDTVDISPAVDGIDTVRLIGVDAPETKEPGCEVQPYGPDASRFTTSELQG